MSRAALDLKGKKFERLLVVERADFKNQDDSHVVWECLCDCGEITYVTSVALVSKNTKSCGCLRREKAAETAKARKKPKVYTPMTLKQAIRRTRSVIKKNDCEYSRKEHEQLLDWLVELNEYRKENGVA